VSRKKDRERFLALRHADPDYQGFRGQNPEPGTSQNTTLQVATCSICGRKRNVPAGTDAEQLEDYVCLSCREEEEDPEAPTDEDPGASTDEDGS
jgi:hypothetical protein